MLQFDMAASWRELSFVSVDVETTGFDAAEERVIEVGIVRFDRGQRAERWGSLVNPGIPIPAKITEITGITDDMVADKPDFRQLKWEIWGRLRDRLFLAYNAGFDRGFLEAEMTRVGLTLPPQPVLDPLVWARKMMPSNKSHKLGVVCSALGVSLENAHRAEDDAEAAGLVALRFADKLPITLGQLIKEQGQWSRAQEEAFAARRAARAAQRAARGGSKAPAASEEPAAQKKQEGLF